MNPSPPPNLRTLAIIDTNALLHNYTALSDSVAAYAPSCAPISVIKANAYGHGVDIVAPMLWQAGCRHFAVATLDEAIKVKQILSPHTPECLLVLGYTPPACAATAAESGITLTCVSLQHAQSLSEAACTAGVSLQCHAALDTGMNRIGVSAHNTEEIQTAIQEIATMMTLDGLEITGMFTHFAKADEAYEDVVSPDGRTMIQYRRYCEVCHGLAELGLRPAFCHICNSAAAIRLPPLYPDVCIDGVRFGISLYGYGVSPLPHHRYTLRPVMRLYTHIAHLHTLHVGEQVGYGGRFSADSPRTIATLPIGYADGFRRGFEGGTVILHTASGDFSAPIVGRVCMDQCMIDVTHLPVSLGDAVLLFGDQGPGFPAPQLTLEALCERADTIPYEILCQITERVPRIEISHDKKGV